MIMCHLAVDTTFGSKFPVFVCDEEQQYPIAVPSIVLMRLLQAKHPNKGGPLGRGRSLCRSVMRTVRCLCPSPCPHTHGTRGGRLRVCHW